MAKELTIRDLQKKSVRVAIDLETTGLDPRLHEIWEIAIIPFDKNYEPLPGQFKARIAPENPMTIQPKALEVGGITKEELLKIPCNWNQVWSTFNEWRLEMYMEYRFIPVGHNYDSFDKQFILAKVWQEHYDMHFDHNCFDTKQIACWLRHLGKISCESMSLRNLAVTFGLDKLYKGHSAYGDAMTCIKLLEVFEKLSR